MGETVAPRRIEASLGMSWAKAGHDHALRAEFVVQRLAEGQRIRFLAAYAA